MDIPAFGIRNSVKFLSENCIGREPGKKNLFLCFRNGFQYIEMDTLRTTQGKPVEKKE